MNQINLSLSLSLSLSLLSLSNFFLFFFNLISTSLFSFPFQANARFNSRFNPKPLETPPGIALLQGVDSSSFPPKSRPGQINDRQGLASGEPLRHLSVGVLSRACTALPERREGAIERYTSGWVQPATTGRRSNWHDLCPGAGRASSCSFLFLHVINVVHRNFPVRHRASKTIERFER